MKHVHDKSSETVVYIRSNSVESLNLQQLRSKEYADQQSLSINIIVDTNTSGLSSLFERPGMGRLLQMVKDKEINTIIVDTLCRVSRDAYQLLLFTHFLKGNHIKLVVLDGGVEDDN